MRWCCATRGHVTASGAVECLICDREPKPGEKLHKHILHGLGEMADFRDVASVPEWGPGDTGVSDRADTRQGMT